MSMTDKPERIWIEQDECPYFYVESELAEVGSPVTEYIRADLCHRPEPEVRRQALEEAAKKAEELLVYADTTSRADKVIPAAIRAIKSRPAQTGADRHD